MPLIKVSAGTPLLPPGTYPATVVGISPKSMVTKYSKNGEEQDFLEWEWLVEGQNDDISIRSLTTVATGPKSRIFEYLVALLGADKVVVDAGFDEADLVGKRALVKIVTTDEGFAKIDGVVAAPRQRNAAVEASPIRTEPRRAPAPEALPDDDDLPF